MWAKFLQFIVEENALENNHLTRIYWSATCWVEFSGQTNAVICLGLSAIQQLAHPVILMIIINEF